MNFQQSKFPLVIIKAWIFGPGFFTIDNVFFYNTYFLYGNKK